MAPKIVSLGAMITLLVVLVLASIFTILMSQMEILSPYKLVGIDYNYVKEDIRDVSFQYSDNISNAEKHITQLKNTSKNDLINNTNSFDKVNYATNSSKLITVELKDGEINNNNSMKTDSSNNNENSKSNEIVSKADDATKNTKDLLATAKPMCPETPPDLKGKLGFSYQIKSDRNVPSLNEIFATYKPEPLNCVPRRKLAIIIPYRNREVQLRKFLQHMHPVFRRQQLDYTIFVIEQSPEAPFNRAKLLNIGFTEASKVRDFDCYFFHDVDILMENDKCLYCQETHTRHFATQMDKFGYKKLGYAFPICHGSKLERTSLIYFGGITRINKHEMREANGFSNIYWAWGAEDDDFYLRLKTKGFDPKFTTKPECRVSMIKHDQEKVSPSKDFLLRHSLGRMEFDGLNSLNYSVTNYNKTSLFTMITVDIGLPPSVLTSSVAIKAVQGSFCDTASAWIRTKVFNMPKKK